jgi:hypothetical protein
MRFYIKTKPEHIRQGKNSLLFSVSQTHRRRFAKSKTAAGRAHQKQTEHTAKSRNASG